MALTALALVAFLGVAGVVLQATVRPRVDDAAGLEARVQAARADVESGTADLADHNLLTKYALATQDLQAAMRHLDAARALAPDDPEVRTHLAALRIVIGRNEEAEAGLREALAVRPDLAEARLWLALARGNQGATAEAEALLREVLADPGDEIDRQLAASMLTGLRAAAVVPEPAPARLSGTVEGVAAAGGVLFVYVRPSVVPSGRPLAARRFTEWSLPQSFTLSEDDLIGGGAWPDQVWIQAKVSRSGDPLQPSPDDLESAVSGPHAAGDTVTLRFGDG
jgi:tetratricopeptide (TPR) repeat protein